MVVLSVKSVLITRPKAREIRTPVSLSPAIICYLGRPQGTGRK